MNKLTTEYWNSYMIWNLFINICISKYRNPRNKTEALVLLKKRNTFVFQTCLDYYLIAMHRICITACAIISAAHILNNH